MEANTNTLRNHAANIRRNIIESGYHAGAMHFGGVLSMVDIMAFLYGELMNYDATNPQKPERDRFILSKGHCGLALYATLCEFGFINHDQLMQVDANGGEFPSHCVQNIKFGIELSSGSLGLGLSFAIGQSLGLPRTRMFVLVGNGEINEGSFWESAMFAGAHCLSNVHVVVDDNAMQLDGDSKNVMPVSNWAERLRTFGWVVAEADGHDFDSLRAAFAVPHPSAPLAVVAKTLKGKGVSFMEGIPEWHHNRMNEDQYRIALGETEQSNSSSLGGV